VWDDCLTVVSLIIQEADSTVWYSSHKSTGIYLREHTNVLESYYRYYKTCVLFVLYHIVKLCI